MILYHTHSLLNTNHRNIPSRSASGSSGKWQSSDYSFDGKFQMAGKFVYMTDAYLHLLLQKTVSLSCRDVVSLRVCQSRPVGRMMAVDCWWNLCDSGTELVVHKSVSSHNWIAEILSKPCYLGGVVSVQLDIEILCLLGIHDNHCWIPKFH